MRFWPGGQTPQNSQDPGEGPAHPFRTCPVGQDSHLKQALGELEKLPAGHWLSTQAEPCPANENLPASQLVQAAELVCAVKPENLPASQSVQEVAPEVAAENFPAAQVVQV